MCGLVCPEESVSSLAYMSVHCMHLKCKHISNSDGAESQA